MTHSVSGGAVDATPDVGSATHAVDAAAAGDEAGPLYDVVVIGAGPAGLSAALNLVRARRSVLLVDGNRPRNAATLRSHGFLTRDGVSPLELRKLGRAEVEGYDEATVVQANVERVTRDGETWHVAGAWRGTPVVGRARAVVVAIGLREEFPALPSLRTFYGTSVHSCVECDAYERAGAPLALIGESDDLADRALLVGAWTDDLIVFTNGVGRITADDRARLARAGIRVDDRSIDDLLGDRSGLTGVRLRDGEVVARTGAFVRPIWHADLGFLDAVVEPELRRDADGLVVVDRLGRTGIAGLYAVGDVTPPGPEQLIVAAGHGATTAAAVNRDLIGGLVDVRDAVQ